jgi:hypothetical protein
VGRPEQVLVQSIADDYWRALRGRAYESSRLHMAAEGQLGDGCGRLLAPSNVWIQNHQALSNLALYIQRIERGIRNNTQALEAMQNQRKEGPRQAEEEVKLLARAATAEGRSYDPAPDFPPEGEFVFSSAQVAQMVSREDRLNQARKWQKCDFDPQSKPEEPSYKVFKAA